MISVDIIIDGKNISADVSEYLSRVSYTDNLEMAADDVSLSFEDTGGKWQDSWYPAQGDTLEVKIHSADGSTLDCGLFEIDEVELSLSPDVLAVKGLATPVSKALRTKSSKQFEKQTLRQIAQYFANKHGLQITGSEGKLQKVEVEKKTQDNETDISFLAKLAKEYGITFSIKGKQLVFIDIDELEKKSSVLQLDRSNMSTARFVDKTSQVYEAAAIARRSMRKNAVKKWDVKEGKAQGSKNEIVLNSPAASEAEGKQKTEQQIKDANRQKITGSITLEGNTAVVAGVNIDIADVGKFSGKWHVKSSSHSVEAGSGYITTAEIYRIQ